MTSRERVLTTLQHKEPDRIPFDLGSTKVTGIHRIAYQKLRPALGLEEREPIIYDTNQQMALVEDDVLKALEVDTRETMTQLPPKHTTLLQNYPNPFNPETWIPFQLAKEAEVVIQIYNIKGELVRVLSIGHKSAGCYLSKEKAVFWNGKNQSGEAVANGLYFYTLKAGEFQATRKMILVK